MDTIKYVVAICTLSICAFMFIAPLGSQRACHDPVNVLSGSQATRSEISAFDTSLLDSRHYVKGPATGRFRDNLREEFRYITAWNFAGMTNDFMVYINLIFLAYMSHRIPIIPPFIPASSHIGHNGPVLLFGDVYDLPRLREALNWPILEWSDVKKAKYNDTFDSHNPEMDGVEKEVLGCWGAQQAFDKNNRPTPALTPGFLNLEVVYTPIPFLAKLQPKYPPDTHVSFSGLASILRPVGRAEALAAPSAKNHTSFIAHLKDQFHPPDEQLACFDNMYFVASKDTFEWQEPHGPAWNLVGTEARFNPKLDELASSYLRQVFGKDEIPLYIAVHIRRTDFKNWCKGAAIKDCFAPLSAYGERVKQVQEELRQQYGSTSPRGRVTEVLVSSDEDDLEFWKDVRGLGWKYVDYEAMETVNKHGLWYPSLLDTVIHSRAAGFVGTEKSTMSLVAARRVNDWHGGATRQTWPGQRFALENIKYVVAACTVTICGFIFISPLGSRYAHYDPANVVVPELQATGTEISAFDMSLLDSHRYVKGPATGRFRDNLKEEFQYITAWDYAGMTNDFMININLIFLAHMSHRIPIIPPFIPSSDHIGPNGPVLQFSDVYDLPRLREALKWPILEWSDVKIAGYNEIFDDIDPEMEGVEEEMLGCWGAQQAFNKDNYPTASLTPGFLNLEVGYTPVPYFVKLQPKNPPDTHVSFSGLASILRPVGRAEALAAPSAKNYTSFVPHLKDQSLPPDEQLACFDNLYFVASKDTFEWQERHGPAWNLVGTEARFTPKLDELASSYLRLVFGKEEVPLYIAVHIRRTDFKDACKGGPIEDCLPPLSTYGERVRQVQEELRQQYGSTSPRGNVTEVLVSSDENDPKFWKDVLDLGWKYVNHEAMETVDIHGLW
ncbi:hypothetical protein FRC01_010624 [Tulasnella sp. 417]|nr:hypothetical protein FRC01_010624 [Tulasnella sp. 417]